MVESGKDCVLQWSGHAAHVTERFSGLLARQALVDVTLICQGQKLRVHKLVLASCSLYFEEMLEEDLGQEPIILLRDLDFNVLKAMVEFMYCGETTVSRCHLQTLFHAAQVFKVKELECIANSMLRSEKSTERRLSQESENSEEGAIGSIGWSADRKRCCSKMHPNGERFHDFEEDAPSKCKNDQTLDDNNGTSCCYGEEDVEHSLYECTNLTSEIAADCPQEDQRKSSDKRSNATVASSGDSELSKTFAKKKKKKTTTTKKKKKNDGKRPGERQLASPRGENDFKSIFVERCCNFTNESTALNENARSVNENNSLHSQFEHQDTWNVVGECSKVYTHKKCKYAEGREREEEDCITEHLSDSPIESSSAEDNFFEDSRECPENEANRYERCLKVYTHKRRKPLDKRKHCSANNPPIDCLREEKCTSNTTTTTSCIDLSDEASRNNQPVTLPPELDMETSEYIWNLSSESIQRVVGCTINQSSGLASGKEEQEEEEGMFGVPRSEDLDFERTTNNVVAGNNKRVGHSNELFTADNESLGAVVAPPPVLRRSVRINQLENDDSINNNGNAVVSGNLMGYAKVREKNRDMKNEEEEDCSGNRAAASVGRAKRKMSSKDRDYRISDENNATTNTTTTTTTTTTTRTQQTLQKNNSRSLRSSTSSRLASEKRSGTGTRYTPARHDKDQEKSKMNGKIRKIGNADCDVLVPVRLNTIASVDRALWGDMSEVLENRKYGAAPATLVADYSPSKDIPFAVGLLPLRAALERMQATLDHQPRKTRSSVAPLNAFKRKDAAEMMVATKKHNGNEPDVLAAAAANTVCHIEIRTSSQCTQNRRTSPSEHMVAVGSTLETNGR